jgi:2-pyrone-4,6-dicarboxylate lactonase
MKTCKAPDRNPIKPSYVMPPGACDAHCHVFGPADTFPYAPERSYTPPDAPVAMLRELHQHLGISRAVIVQATCHGTDNTAMLDAIASSNGAYRGVAMVAKDVSDAELQRLHDGGVRGVRFNFVRHLEATPEPAVFNRTIEQIKHLGWHVVVHLDAQDIETVSDRLNSIPIPFIVDHMGRVKAAAGVDQPPFRRLLELLRENELAWVKVSGAERVSAGRRPFADAIPFAAALIDTAPHRVLWGTDFPHPNISADMPNDGELVDLFAMFTQDEARRKAVVVDNPSRLYWNDSPTSQ